jgi:hypothetical protein
MTVMVPDDSEAILQGNPTMPTSMPTIKAPDHVWDCAMTMGVIIVILMDGMGSILARLQGRRCVPDHLTRCPMLDGVHEGGLVGGHQGYGGLRGVSLPHLHPIEGLKEVRLQGYAQRQPPLKVSLYVLSPFRGGVRPEVPVNWAQSRSLQTREATRSCA